MFLNKIKRKLNSFFTKGHERTIVAKKNIAISLFIKSLSIAINLLLVPMTINYVNPTQYGIWLTLSSIVIWFGYFDIGLGNGLRNKFAEAKATGNYNKAKIYVSTTYAALIIIFSSLWLIFYLANNFIDWAKVLNASPKMADELSCLGLIVFSFFCLQMVFKIISTVFTADQKPAKTALINLLGQILTLLIIYILLEHTEGSLIYLSLALGFSPVFILIISSIYFYNKDYYYYRPSLKYVKLSYVKDILSIGGGFFIIQVAVIIVYETNNLIIAHIGSPKDVTIFNIAYKYMSIVFMVFSIIMSPFWSAFTDAFTKSEYGWMKNTVKKLRIISYFLMASLILFLILAEYIYPIWIGDAVEIPFNITLVVGVYVATLIVLGANNQILNGIGKIRVQILSYSFAMIFHIPLALYLGDKLGITGVLISAIFFYIVICFFSIKQVNLLVSNRAKGIWNK